jgi:zinc transport system substrate-binding protein
MKTRQIMVGLLISLVCGLGLVASVQAADPIQVVVSIPPQTYFVRQVGGERVEAMSLLPEGGLPHSYEPTPQQMTVLSKADLYVRIQVEFENAWWDKMQAVNPTMHVVDSTAGIDLIEGHAHSDHVDEAAHHENDGRHHEHEGEHHAEAAHTHHGRDPHVWLSPQSVEIQANAICEGLIQIDPAHKQTYQANCDAFAQALEQLDQEIQQQLADLQTRKFMIFHPAWSYYARDYDLEQIPIEIEGKEPSAKEMTQIMQQARAEHIETIFVQPQTSRRSADTIAQQIGADVKVLDPLASDWMDNMRRVTAILAETLSK